MKKSFIILAISILCVPTLVDALCFTCPTLLPPQKPTRPAIPNGYYAEAYQMESAKSEIEFYLNDVDEYIDCMKKCIEEARSEAEQVVEEWNAAVRAYNSR